MLFLSEESETMSKTKVSRIKCEVCEKPNQDKENDLCYGCGHILCTDCCYDPFNSDIIGSPHNIRTHRHMFWAKVELGSWQSKEYPVGDA